MSTQSLTTTINGATALKTSGDNIVDFFMMFSRSINTKLINKYLKKCWITDPIKTIAIIFNGRDRKNGKKEKKISNISMLWLRKNKPHTYKLNILKYIEKYGCWKDINFINYFSYNTQIIKFDYELNLIVEQLKKDKINLINGENISLCSKWAPSEKCRNDKKKHIVNIIADILYPNDFKSKEKYRKEYLVPLRKQLKLVETKMCNNDWDTINYQDVPGVASNRLKKAFIKHDKERYLKFLEDVNNGNKKINTTGVLPHELVKFYLNLKEKNEEPYEQNETIEVMWKALINDVKKNGKLEGLIPISDVSGSMYCNNNIPILVSIALGILISKCNDGVFRNKIISFSRYPTLFELKGETLFENFNEIINMDAGYDTDFEAVSDLIISHAKMYSVPQENMIKKIIVLSDMQFNQASHGIKNVELLHDFITNKYNESNYNPPDFIYWNLNPYDATFPVESNKEGTVLVSGFSEQLLKTFMNYEKITPSLMVKDILEPYLLEVSIFEDEIWNNEFSDDDIEENQYTENINYSDDDSNSEPPPLIDINNNVIYNLQNYGIEKNTYESESENEEDILNTIKNNNNKEFDINIDEKNKISVKRNDKKIIIELTL